MWFSHGSRTLGRGRQVQIPEKNLTSSAKNSKFCLNPGRTETATNSPRKPFLQSCFHFQAILEIWKYQEDIFSLTWKHHFFSSREKLFDRDFFSLLCTAQGTCRHVVPMPNLPYLHVFSGGDWLSVPLLNSILASAQNHYKVGRTKTIQGYTKWGQRSCCQLKVTLFSTLILLNKLMNIDFAILRRSQEGFFLDLGCYDLMQHYCK